MAVNNITKVEGLERNENLEKLDFTVKYVASFADCGSAQRLAVVWRDLAAVQTMRTLGSAFAPGSLHCLTVAFVWAVL